MSFRTIVLTSCIGTLYTNILKDRWTSFLVGNEYWCTLTQKAFLPGVSGCTEHQFVAFQDARSHQRTLCSCWLDFRNAFGSVHHNLIHFDLERYHGSDKFRHVVKNLYDGLSACVSIRNWITESFRYQIGVFQGDQLSVAIFTHSCKFVVVGYH